MAYDLKSKHSKFKHKNYINKMGLKEIYVFYQIPELNIFGSGRAQIYSKAKYEAAQHLIAFK